jgi:hypothetical protein
LIHRRCINVTPAKFGIHALRCCSKQRRGCRAFARHDEAALAKTE